MARKPTTDAPAHEQPTLGGSYVRGEDGKLTRAEFTATDAEPKPEPGATEAGGQEPAAGEQQGEG